MIQNKVRHLLVISTESNGDEKKLPSDDRISPKPMGIITPLTLQGLKSYLVLTMTKIVALVEY